MGFTCRTRTQPSLITVNISCGTQNATKPHSLVHCLIPKSFHPTTHSHTCLVCFYVLLCPRGSLKHSVISGRRPSFGALIYQYLGCKSGNQTKKELLFTKQRTPSKPRSQCQCFLLNPRTPRIHQQKGPLPNGLPFLQPTAARPEGFGTV